MFIHRILDEKHLLLNRSVQLLKNKIPFIGFMNPHSFQIALLLEMIEKAKLDVVIMIPFKIFVDWNNKKQIIYMIPQTVKQLEIIQAFKKEKEDDHIPMITKEEKEMLLEKGITWLSFDYGLNEKGIQIETSITETNLKAEIRSFTDSLVQKEESETWDKFFEKVYKNYEDYCFYNQELFSRLHSSIFMEKEELAKEIKIQTCTITPY